MLILVSSKELITMYVGLELATVSLYALTAIYKKDNLALEGGIKYSYSAPYRPAYFYTVSA